MPLCKIVGFSLSGASLVVFLLYLHYLHELQDNLWRPPILSNSSQLNIYLFTWGSRGDIEPLVAIGHELAVQGHNVTLFCRARYRYLVLNTGLVLHEMPEDGTELLMKELLEFDNPSHSVLHITSYWGKLVSIWLAEWESEAAPDLVLASQYVHLPAIEYARKKQKPLFIVNFIPYFPSTEFADFWASNGDIKNFGLGFLNWLSYLPVQIIQGMYMTAPLNEWRAKNQIPSNLLDLAYRRQFWGQFPQFFVHEPSLFPIPKDIPEWYHYTGKFVLGNRSETDRNLIGFINGGSMPYYIGLGSMEGYNKTKFSLIVAKLLLQTGKRAILQELSFDTQIIRDNLPSNAYYLASNIDHGSIFPMLSIIIHHGGSGHVSSCIRAGKPSVVLSFFLEHVVWGTRLQKLNAGVVLAMQSIEDSEVDKSVSLLSHAIQQASLDHVVLSAKKLSQNTSPNPQKQAVNIIFRQLQAWKKEGL